MKKTVVLFIGLIASHAVQACEEFSGNYLNEVSGQTMEIVQIGCKSVDLVMTKMIDGQPYTLRSEYSEPFGWDENDSHFRSAFMGNHFFAESSSYKMDSVKGLVNGYRMIAYYMTANGDLLQREMSVSSEGKENNVNTLIWKKKK